MKRREEYQAKVTDDSGLTRGRVPCPLLAAMKARPGDHLTFRLTGANKVVMQLSRSQGDAGKDGGEKAAGSRRKTAGGRRKATGKKHR